MKVGKRVKLPSLSLITHHNRNIARTVMLMATLFFGWRMASLLWLLAGQDRADLAKPTLAPVTSNVAVVDGSRLATFSIFKVNTAVSDRLRHGFISAIRCVVAVVVDFSKFVYCAVFSSISWFLRGDF